MSYYFPIITKPKIMVVDDHELILVGTIDALRRKYPEAEIHTAKTAQSLLQKIETFQPDLFLLDLAIPEEPESTAQTEIGIQILRTLMTKQPHLNIVVLSSNTKALVRLKSEIDRHQGGFTVADKTSIEDLLKKVDWAMEGISYTKDVKELYSGELRPEWYQVLELGSQGLTDKEIAMQINVAERTVWSYWHKIRDVFGIYPEASDRHERKKIQTLMKARELGFLD
ncbi:MAG: response regulator [Cyanophyceae cyanobacterium]